LVKEICIDEKLATAFCSNFCALHVAVYSGKSDVAEYLLSIAITTLNAISTDASKFSPLHFAAQKGNYNLVKLLLSKRANVALQTAKKETALYLACRSCSFKAVNELIQYHADVNVADHELTTPLHICAQNTYCEIAQLLLAHGAQESINAVDERGNTPLHLVASHGQLEMVDILLANNAIINSQNKEGLSPLMLAVSANQNSIADWLISKEADLFLYNNSTPGFTAMNIAVRHQNKDIIKLLSTKNPRTLTYSVEGTVYPPLFVAVESSLELVKFLVEEKGVDPNQKFGDFIAADVEPIADNVKQYLEGKRPPSLYFAPFKYIQFRNTTNRRDSLDSLETSQSSPQITTRNSNTNDIGTDRQDEMEVEDTAFGNYSDSE